MLIIELFFKLTVSADKKYLFNVMIKNNRLTYGMFSNNSLSDVFIHNFVYMFRTIFAYNFGYVFAGLVF